MNKALLKGIYLWIKQSWKDFDRENYQALKRCLRKGDLLYIKSIDRFGRNSKEIKKEWKDKKITAVEAVGSLHLKKSTFYKLVKQFDL